MTKRAFRGTVIASCACIILAVLVGCQSIGNMKSDFDQSRDLKRLKRGSISSDGLYKNEFFEFELQLPKAWEGSVGDPPIVLTGVPPAKAFPDASARKFVDIQVIVDSVSKEETLDAFVERYLSQNGYTEDSSSNGMVLNAESKMMLLSGKWKENPASILGLVVVRDQKSIVVQCRALRPLFDNVEAQFRYCLGTFVVTAKDIEPVAPEGTPNPFDWKTDHFTYVVQLGETIETIAKQYMGKEDYAKSILLLNEVDSIEPEQKIKLPRYITRLVQEGDTWDSIAEDVLGNGGYASWVKEYNSDVEWSVGAEIHVPLYRMEVVNAREGYLDFAQRVYNNNRYSDVLLIYNDSQHLSLLDRAKIPLFLFAQHYTIRVQTGDTLAFLSSYYTGDPNNYRIIAELNGIARPYTLNTGQMIKIPANLVKDPELIKKPRPKQRPRPRKDEDTSDTTDEVQDDMEEEVAATPTPASEADEMTEIYEPF